MSIVDETTAYTTRDQARLAVAEQAARLADRLHDLVGKHGHDVTVEDWIGLLVAPVLDPEPGRDLTDCPR